MAANIRGVWGIDIGQCALKAVKLRPAAEGGGVELVAFDVIEHAKILSQPDADRGELVQASLAKFAERNELSGDKFIIGVPGHQTFGKFAKLPPVESKSKIAEIVKYEASQQIPFAMDDVVWDYEVFRDEDSPEVEVGIFAMRRDLIRGHLAQFGAIKVVPTAIQTAPLSLYNFYRFENEDEMGDGEARVIVDVGAQHTNLVVVEKNSAWTRNISLGGNNFTEALIKAFKLSFSKAENLKRSAATSKYARQIFQAMRPIFADLVAEIQRSLGFYASTHREVEIKQVIACGNAFLLPGLQKYLENNLTISGGVHKLEKFKRLQAGESNAPDFTNNVLTFGPSYGLALQGLGLARIQSNLLPPELARIAMWKKKQPWFAAAAACTAVAAIMPWARVQMDSTALAADSQQQLLRQAQSVVSTARDMQSKFGAAASSGQVEQERVNKLFALSEHRALIPKVIAFVHESLPEIDPRVRDARTPEELKQAIQSDPGRLARNRRKQIIIEAFDIQFSENIDDFDRPQDLQPGLASTGGGGPGGAGFGRGGPFGGGGDQFVGRDRFGETGRGFTPPTTPYGGGGEGEASAGVGEGAGFYVRLAGRITYGRQQSEVAEMLFTDYYPRLLELGRTKGLGFWVPEEDAKSNGGNLPQFPNLQSASGHSDFMQPTDPFRQGGTPESAEREFKDPVTGEDISQDWTFSLGFKIRLGEPPDLEGDPDEGHDEG